MAANHPKSYIIQYDFRKYFDTIDHGYLESLISDRDLFLITRAERNAIRAFLSHAFAHVNDYPLIDDPAQLISLDGWLANVMLRAMRERVKVLHALGIVQSPITKQEILSGAWYNYPQVLNDAQLPSFVRGWRAARRYYLRYGLKNIEPPSYYSLLY